MKIIKTKRLQDNVNFVIEYEKDGKLYGLIISAEEIVKNYEAVEQLRALDTLTCVACDKPIENKEVYCFDCYAE